MRTARGERLSREDLVGDDVVGVVYRPERPGPRTAIVLGGSGGGVPDAFARRVAATGITAVGVAYFGVSGWPATLLEIPLERVEAAIEVVRRRLRLELAPALVGSSKGTELALSLAGRVGDLVGPVVAASPTCVSWYGLDGYGRPAFGRPSFTWTGQPVPHLAYPPGARPSFSSVTGMRVDGCYDLADHSADAVERAQLPVEAAAGPVLVLAGADDHMWGSAAMARRLVERMRAAGRAEAISCTEYPDAGHVFLHADPRLPPPSMPPMVDFGGTPDGDAAAFRDGWRRIGAFLADAP